MSTKLRKDGTERKAKIAIIQKAVLYALAAAGGLTVALVAPNALQVLEQLGWVKTKRSAKDTISKSIERLLLAKLIGKNAKGFVNLTTKGQKRLSEIERADFHLPRPARWDGKWRLVSFDIKEKRKQVRALLRATLASVGFVHLHHSVWVYPHDCEDFLSLLKTDYHIGVEILYIIAEYIENDRWLRKHFHIGEFAGI